MKAPLSLLLLAAATSAFIPRPPTGSKLQHTTNFMTIVSPFDESAESSDDSAVATQESSIGEGPFDLTWDNVEMVLDEMRPFLIQDGGNVVIQEIDGPVVKLELQVRSKTARK